MRQIRTYLKRAREEEDVDKARGHESDCLYFIMGMVNVWADDTGLNKQKYAMEMLEKIKTLNLDFKHHQAEKWGLD